MHVLVLYSTRSGNEKTSNEVMLHTGIPPCWRSPAQEEQPPRRITLIAGFLQMLQHVTQNIYRGTRTRASTITSTN